MSSRVIKDCISNHPVVAPLTDAAQDQLLRWILLADDWGCFNADPDEIKGACYAKRPKFTVKRIQELLLEFYEAGFLFCWTEKGIVWGYWTWWETGEFCGVRSFNQEGDRTRNRRKTPEPPKELLANYLLTHAQVVTQLGASGSSWEQASSLPRSPSPVPVPCSLSPILSVSKKQYGEFQSVELTDEEYAKLETKLNSHLAGLIEDLDNYSQTHPKEFREYTNHYAVIQSWHRLNLKRGNHGAHSGNRNGIASAAGQGVGGVRTYNPKQ